MNATSLSKRSLAVVLTTILLLVAIPAGAVFAATSGPNYPTAASGTSWSGTGNLFADDTNYATYSIASSATSTALNATGYGFSIPTNATINGVTVEISRSSSSSQAGLSINDATVRLLINGVAAGNNKATSSDWPTNIATATYGGGADTWGIAGLSPSDINNANFGVTLSATNQSSFSSRTASVDYMRITVTYTVVQQTPTLSVTNSPVTYNGNPQAATVTGSVPGTVSDVKYDGSSTVPTNAGTYAITADFVPTDTTNYSSLSDASAGNFVINKVTPTVSITNSPVTYDGNPQAAAVSGSVAGSVSDVKYNGSSTVPTNAGTYAITADFTPTDTTNYNALSDASAGNFVINKTTPTASITNSPVTYNGEVQTAQVACLGGGAATLTSGGTGTNAGSYPATVDCAASTNYNAATDLSAGNFVINKATPTASITNSPVTYNGAVQTAQVACSGGGAATLVSGGSGTNAGSYPATVDCAASTNYNAATDLPAGNFVINKVTPTASITNSPVTYNGEVQTAQVACLGGGAATLASGGTGTDAGSYPATVDCAASTNYNAATDLPAGDFVINKATPTASITNSPVIYNGEVQTATIACSGGGAATLASGGTGTDAGSYPATVDCAASTNYNAATGLSAGNFMIDPANQSVTFGALVYKFLGDPDFAVSATASSGLPVSFSSTTTDVCTVTADGSVVHLVSIGTCTIQASQAGNTNYNAALSVDRSFVVYPTGGQPLTITGVTVDNKVYDGTTTATLNAGGAALVGVSDGDDVTLDSSGATAEFIDKNVGTGKTVIVSGFTLSGADASKYFLAQPTPTADITALDLTVSAIGVNKVYDGTTVATVNFTSDALAGDVVTFTYTASFADANVGNDKPVSVSNIAASGTDAGNYNLLATTANTTANITPAPLTVTANNHSKTINQLDPTFTFSYNGFVNGETSAVLNTLPTCGVSVPHSAAGTYPIVCSGGADDNYNLSYVNGTLTVNAVMSQTFDDVPTTYWAWSFIERLYSARITGGCGTSPLIYCPAASVTRAQMAVFLLKGIHGSSYSPPEVGSSTGFGDVPTTHWAAKWIKQLAVEKITGGCGSGNYCPDAPVTRAQMAIFLLKARHGSSYSPPAIGATTGFGDVPTTHWAAAWIKQLAAEAITGGCGNSNYCPDAPVTRAQMAVFLVKTFNLP